MCALSSLGMLSYVASSQVGWGVSGDVDRPSYQVESGEFCDLFAAMAVKDPEEA